MYDYCLAFFEEGELTFHGWNKDIEENLEEFIERVSPKGKIFCLCDYETGEMVAGSVRLKRWAASGGRYLPDWYSFELDEG